MNVKDDAPIEGGPAEQPHEKEQRLCTCGAAGSGEEHEDWCAADALNTWGEHEARALLKSREAKP